MWTHTYWTFLETASHDFTNNSHHSTSQNTPPATPLSSRHKTTLGGHNFIALGGAANGASFKTYTLTVGHQNILVSLDKHGSLESGEY
jgi:hypothetical protein